MMFEHPKFGQEFEDGELEEMIKSARAEHVRATWSDGSTMETRTHAYKLKKYGMTIEDYDRMVELQCGCCAICGIRPDKRLVVDHEHETGAIRGLLCGPCNTVLGMSYDDPGTLRAAAKYIEEAWERNPLDCE